MREARQAGFWKLISRVFVENTPSRTLLVSLGFREVGVYFKHGQLDGVWRDVVIVEKLLQWSLSGSPTRSKKRPQRSRRALSRTSSRRCSATLAESARHRTTADSCRLKTRVLSANSTDLSQPQPKRTPSSTQYLGFYAMLG